MASRRQKFKPLAGIQKARRAQSTISESITKDLIKIEDSVSVKIEDNKTDENETVAETVEPTMTGENLDQQSADPPEEKPKVSAPPRPLQRSIKPSVVIPDRRRKLAQTVEVKAEENKDKPADAEPVEKVQRKPLTPATPLTPLKLKQENSENIQKPDETFKSPFLSPSISHHQKRPEFVYNPLDQPNPETFDDPTKSPVHSNKVRQRIRPTPYFGRRNSVQGSVSESDDETNKRQRHVSTSSNHSNYNINVNNNNNSAPRTATGDNVRARTESVCSNISEIAFQTLEQTKLQKLRNRKSSAARNIAGSETIYDHEFALASRKNRKQGTLVTNNDSLPAFDNTFSKPTIEEKPTITVIKNEYLMPNAAKNKVQMGPLSPQDILNMDIVFADTENTVSNVDEQQSQHLTPTGIVQCEEEIITPDNDYIFVNCEPASKTKVKIENVDENSVDNEEPTEMEKDDYDSNNESIDSLSMKELAVVASHSVDDPNNVIYEVYAVSATTGQLSEKPLDLPPDVVEQIRMSIGV